MQALAKEREEREARLKAEARPVLGAVVDQQPGRAEGRNRKSSVPQRRPPRDEEAGDDRGTSAKRLAAAEQTAVEIPAVKKKKSQTGRKQGPAAISSSDFVDSGSAFDPQDVAGAFIRNDFGEGREALGASAFDQFVCAARLCAIETNKVTITEEDSGEGGSGPMQISVVFTGNNRKTYTDRCRAYAREQIIRIFRAILSYNQTASRRRASSARHLLTAAKLAERYPPLLWSIYRSEGGSADVKSCKRVEAMVAALVTEAETA